MTGVSRRSRRACMCAGSVAAECDARGGVGVSVQVPPAKRDGTLSCVTLLEVLERETEIGHGRGRPCATRTGAVVVSGAVKVQ